MKVMQFDTQYFIERMVLMFEILERMVTSAWHHIFDQDHTKEGLYLPHAGAEWNEIAPKTLLGVLGKGLALMYFAVIISYGMLAATIKVTLWHLCMPLVTLLVLLLSVKIKNSAVESAH